MTRQLNKTYLCGGINGLSDGECNDWRTTAKALLKGETLDPMRRDYRGIEQDSVQEIVHGDLRDIDECAAVLVNATRPSWGTAMETVYAFQAGKTIAAFTESAKVSPWLTYHCHVLPTLEEVVAALNSGALTPKQLPRYCHCRKLCICTVADDPHCHYCKSGMESK